jgi:2-methylfumaryl-CoA isomerase
MNSILKGLRIVEVSAFVAAPSAGMTLAQMGADVIRVDMPGGGPDIKRWPLAAGSGRSLYWAGLNKAKRSICLDLRRPEGREIVADLVGMPGDGGGILISNLPLKNPLDFESLRARRSDVIVVSIVGTRSGQTAVDYTVNAAAGFPMATGPDDRTSPINSPLPAWDLITGQTAALGLLAAERHRRQTGEGQAVRIALEDVALANAGHLGFVGEGQVNGAERPRLGNELYGTFGRDFTTRDGQRLMLVAISDKQWRSLVGATGWRDRFDALATALWLDLEREADRYRGRKGIATLLDAWFGEHDFSAVAEAFTRNGVCWAPYRTFLELAREDERCSIANPLFAEVEQPGIGIYAMPGSCIDFGRFPRRGTLPAPLLGAHTEEVLASFLGMNDEHLAALRTRGIIPPAPTSSGQS